GPFGTTAPGGQFNISDLINSALYLDDLSPIYAANLFPLATTRGFGTEEAEREETGVQFGNVYTNRQLGCIVCHNSTFSTTGPQTGWNRSFTPPGDFERALFGAPPWNPTRANAVFRGDVFGSAAPWGMNTCNTLRNPTAFVDDPILIPLGLDGFFVRNLGLRGNIWDVVSFFRDGLHANLRQPDESLDSPDAAFAYMVALGAANRTWANIMGYPLLIPNNLSRNATQRDILRFLSEFTLIPSNWSLKELLVTIVASDYFNRPPPRTTDGATVYE